MPNGYERPTPVGIMVRADMLEITAGWPDEARTDMELAFALGSVDDDDPATLRWLACCIARKLDDMEARDAVVTT